LGQGVVVTARTFGISRVPAVKGQGMPAHDPRVEIGTGIGYATSTQGADHTGVIIYRADSLEQMVEATRLNHIKTAVCDTMGLCQMTEPSLEVMAKLASGFYGWEWDVEEVTALGKSVLREERAFNRAAGLGPATDRLPHFFKEEALPPNQGTFNVPDSELDRVIELLD
jgi:aldehyde:ferredoxin oxidoreductase